MLWQPKNGSKQIQEGRSWNCRESSIDIMAKFDKPLHALPSDRLYADLASHSIRICQTEYRPVPTMQLDGSLVTQRGPNRIFEESLFVGGCSLPKCARVQYLARGILPNGERRRCCIEPDLVGGCAL